MRASSLAVTWPARGRDVRAGQQHRELVATHARDGVRGPQGAGQHLTDLLQHHVAGFVAERIVQLFEAIQVQDQQRPVRAIAFGRQHQLLQPIVQQRPIGEAGQGVVQRMVLELGLHLATVGDVGDGAGEHQWTTVGGRQRRGGDRHPGHAAILADHPDVELAALARRV
jgi:hypothetical protein